MGCRALLLLLLGCLGCAPWRGAPAGPSAARQPQALAPSGQGGPAQAGAPPVVALQAKAGEATATAGASGASEPSAGSRAADGAPLPRAPEGTAPGAASASAPSPGGAAQESTAGEQEEIDDDVELLARETPAAAQPVPAALAGLSDGELMRRLETDPASLGPMSIGQPNSGALVNGVTLRPSPHWVLMDAGNAWGTRETVDYLTRAIEAVHARYPDAPKTYIGHLSSKTGGHLAPHKSHQAGRDVDISYYYSAGDVGWYRRVTADNLDAPKTWLLVRTLLAQTDVEYIFINSSVQKLLKEHALSIGEDASWLDLVFQYNSKQPDPIIRHAPGHDTHIHVRFYNPTAQELGRRAYPLLVKLGKIKPPQVFVQHRAMKGDTLGSLARRYHTTVPAIQHANGLRNTALVAKRTYLIPKEGQVVIGPMPPVRIPPRRLPPGAPQASTAAGPSAGAAAP